MAKAGSSPYFVRASMMDKRKARRRPIFVVILLVTAILLLALTVGTPAVTSSTRKNEPLVWTHALNDVQQNTKCKQGDREYDGECIAPHEIGKVRYDPCNPRGQRVIREQWRVWNGRAGVLSSTLGILERHRFDCIVVPQLIETQIKARLAQMVTANLSATTLSYKNTPFTRPLRVLVFGPHGELGKMRSVVEVALRAEKYPVDYVQADLSDLICKQYGAMKINAMKIQFPDAFFSAVFFSHVLEHVPDMNTTLSEISRVLEPQGWALLSAPVNPSLPRSYEDPHCTTRSCRLKKFGQEDHIRHIGMDLFSIIQRYFDAYRHDFTYNFFRKRTPELAQLFANPEYHEDSGSKKTYTYAFKGVHPEEIKRVFGDY